MSSKISIFELTRNYKATVSKEEVGDMGANDVSGPLQHETTTQEVDGNQVSVKVLANDAIEQADGVTGDDGGEIVTAKNDNDDELATSMEELDLVLNQPETPDDSHIEEAIEVRDDLNDLADQVETNPDVSLEHYHWVLAKTLNRHQAEIPSVLSVENYSDSRMSRRSFAKEIRGFSKCIDRNIQTSLEAFSESIDKQLKEAIAANTAIHKQLEVAIQKHGLNPVAITNRNALSLFIVDNYLINDVDIISEEVPYTIDYILDTVEDYVNDADKTGFSLGTWLRKKFDKKVDLLLNREMVIGKDSVHIKQGETDVEAIIKKAIRSNAVGSLVMSGIGIVTSAMYLTNPTLKASLTPVLAAVFKITGAANVVTSVAGIFTLFRQAKTAKKISDSDFKDFQTAALAILNQSRKLNKLQAAHEALRSKDLEQSTKIQSIILETVKYINDTQAAVLGIYKVSEDAANED